MARDAPLSALLAAAEAFTRFATLGHSHKAGSAQHLRLLHGLRSHDISNEITAIAQRRDQLEIQGRTITIDALGAQPEIAQTIPQAAADYVLCLKGNPPDLWEEVPTYPPRHHKLPFVIR